MKKICAARLSFKQTLKIWATFGRGWTRRVADIEAKGVAMAPAITSGYHDIQQQLGDEAAEARSAASKQESGAVANGGGATGGGAVSTCELAHDPLTGWILLAIVVAAAGATVWLLWRVHVNRTRTATYDKARAPKLHLRKSYPRTAILTPECPSPSPDWQPHAHPLRNPAS